jgi:hypothetical protein
MGSDSRVRPPRSSGTPGTCVIGSNAPAEVQRAEYPLEQAVSSYIGSLPLLWLDVDDPPGPASNRAVIEAGAIALLSNDDRPVVDPVGAGNAFGVLPVRCRRSRGGTAAR